MDPAKPQAQFAPGKRLDPSTPMLAQKKPLCHFDKTVLNVGSN
jgi:hypothetical protein